MIRVAEFLSRWTDEELETVWKYSGMAGAFGDDPEAPYPGREVFGTVMPKFLEPITYSWREILRRAVRTMPTRDRIAHLRALLRAFLSRRPASVRLVLPDAPVLGHQLHRTTEIPTRAP